MKETQTTYSRALRSIRPAKQPVGWTPRPQSHGRPQEAHPYIHALSSSRHMHRRARKWASARREPCQHAAGPAPPPEPFHGAEKINRLVNPSKRRSASFDMPIRCSSPSLAPPNVSEQDDKKKPQLLRAPHSDGRGGGGTCVRLRRSSIQILLEPLPRQVIDLSRHVLLQRGRR